MIAANELRKGNIFYCDKFLFKIESILSSTFKVFCHTLDEGVLMEIYIGNLVPIKITPELLEKAGFEKRPDGNFWLFRNDTGTDCYFDLATMTAKVGDMTLSMPILYVHQIQNLFFSLMQEELIIQL